MCQQLIYFLSLAYVSIKMYYDGLAPSRSLQHIYTVNNGTGDSQVLHVPSQHVLLTSSVLLC
jgi:hypothetical protein